MELLITILEIVTNIVKAIAVIVLLIGLSTNLKDLVRVFISRKNKKEKFVYIQEIKSRLGAVMLLGLEILIIADIIETITNPTFKDIGFLASIVAIRTVISYFLNKEIKNSYSPNEESYQEDSIET